MKIIKSGDNFCNAGGLFFYLLKLCLENWCEAFLEMELLIMRVNYFNKILMEDFCLKFMGVCVQQGNISFWVDFFAKNHNKALQLFIVQFMKLNLRKPEAHEYSPEQKIHALIWHSVCLQVRHWKITQRSYQMLKFFSLQLTCMRQD